MVPLGFVEFEWYHGIVITWIFGFSAGARHGDCKEEGGGSSGKGQ